MFHPELTVIFIILLFVGIFWFALRPSKKAKVPIPHAPGEPQQYEDPTVCINLYGFKQVNHPYGKEYYPELPTREGYAFTGWFYDPSFTKPFMPGKKLKKDITLYPRWQKE